MAKKDVKTNLLSHSQAKVKLLGKYIERYLSIICNEGYIQKIRLYDLFCGEGLYDNEGEGSPLVLLNAVKAIYQTSLENSKKIPQIDCYFNDVEESKINKLQNIVKTKGFHNLQFGNISFSTNDYVSEVDKLVNTLKSLKNEKIFIFIDPYGYKNIKASQIKALMQNKNAEVLLWLPIQHMFRFSEGGTPPVLYDFLEEIKVNMEEGSKNIWAFITELKNAFQKSIGNAFFVDSFSIQKEANTVFCLYFFTSHIKGFEQMLETKWGIDTENGMGWEYKGNTPSLFFGQKTNKLEEKLRAFLVAEKRYNNDVYEFTLRQSYLPKHTNEILEFWQKNNQIDVLLVKNGEKARKGSFYIRYLRPTDSNFQKVYFKLR